MHRSERPSANIYGVGAAGPDPTPDAVYRTPGPRRPLPVLDDLRVAAPCSVLWDGMAGDDRVRTCVQCSKEVFDISNMSRADAEVLLRERVEGVCVRFYRRLDGTILTKDCPIGVRTRITQRALTSAVVAVGVWLLGFVGIRLLSTRTLCGEPTMGATFTSSSE
jgi:hypothetical protein